MTEIQKADPRARRTAAWILALAFALGTIGILAVDHYETAMYAWLEANIEWLVQNAWIVFVAGLVAVLPGVALCTYLYVIGGRIADAARYPAPGLAVTRDTRVVTGRRAVARGRVVQALAGLLVICLIAIPAVLWYIFSMIGRLQ